MTDLPIQIVSPEVEFVIVGPLLITDGLIVASKNVSIDLIGFANSIYFERNLSPKSIEMTGKYHNYDFAWSNNMQRSQFSNQNILEKREFRILYCWKTKTTDIVFNRNNKKVASAFREVSMDIYNIATSEKLTTAEKTNSIKWKVSPLVFQSLFER